MRDKNVLFIMLDQLNYRCLGYMGHPDVKTPNIDALAAEGTCFTNFYTQSPICQPSRISFLTGNYQKTHRQYGFEGMVGNSFELMPRIFRKAGYKTGASGKFHINSLGSDWGFDYLAGTLEEEQDRCKPATNWYPDYIRDKGYKYPTTQAHGSSLGDSVPDDIEKEEKSGRVHEINVDNYVMCAGKTRIPFEHSIEKWTTDRAIEFLEYVNDDEPFFFWLTYDRPHAPHGVSEPFDKLYDPDLISLLPYEDVDEICSKPYDYFKKLRSFFGDDKKLRRVLAAYYAIITCIDSEIGRVVDYLKSRGLYDNTTIIFTSDHGDMAGMHGSFEKDNMADEVIKIPMVIKPPFKMQSDAPKRIDSLCESTDLLPTLLSLHSFEKMDVDGHDLCGLISGNEDGIDNVVFSEQYSIKAIVKDSWKLIYYLDKPYGMLFDLANDPFEKNNLYDDDKYKLKRIELKRELIKKLSGNWDECDKEDVESTIFNYGGRSSKAHYGNVGWDDRDFYVVDYRCMYLVEDNPATYIMMYNLYDDKTPMYKVENGCPCYEAGDVCNELLYNGIYEKFVDGLVDWLIRKITPIDVIGIQASKLERCYPLEEEVAEFLGNVSR
ncbi:MAG: sulfatase [Sedimentisphaeraceae bacterium JB056]